MEEIIIKSEKKNKKFIPLLAWLLAAAITLGCFGIMFLQYLQYKEAQDMAVDLTMAVTDQFNKYSGDREELVSKMYSFYNPTRLNTTINGIRIDNKEAVDAAGRADRALGKLLEELGYDCYDGSKYLRYYGFFDLTWNDSVHFYIIPAVLLVAALVITIINASKAKEELIVFEDSISCRKRSGKRMQFAFQDLSTVETAGKNGIVLKGFGFKYKIVDLKNADELKAVLFEKLMAHRPVVSPMYAPPMAPVPPVYNPPMYAPPAPPVNVPPVNVPPVAPVAPPAPAAPAVPAVSAEAMETLKQYKELADLGVITREEFESKKRQILGL